MERMEMKVRKEEKGRQNVFPKNSDPHVRWSTLCVDEDGLVVRMWTRKGSRRKRVR